MKGKRMTSEFLILSSGSTYITWNFPSSLEETFIFYSGRSEIAENQIQSSVSEWIMLFESSIL